MFAENIVERLLKSIDPRRVKTRSGRGGNSFSYIETHDAIATANEIFGYGNWSYRVDELVCLGTETGLGDSGTGVRVGYRAVVEVQAGSGIGVAFSDVGYGDAIEYGGSTITPHELAAKEAVSDGVKRALKNFGEQFGLSLYSEEGRREIAEAKRAQSALGPLKKQVYELAKETLGKDKPTNAEVAKAFGVKAADLGDVETLQKIVAEHA